MKNGVSVLSIQTYLKWNSIKDGKKFKFYLYPLMRGKRGANLILTQKMAQNLIKFELPKSWGILIGGSAWESNPPARVLAPRTGFEVREPHQ